MGSVYGEYPDRPYRRLNYPAALAALREWKYEPAYPNETPVSVQMIVTISFRLGVGN